MTGARGGLWAPMRGRRGVLRSAPAFLAAALLLGCGGRAARRGAGDAGNEQTLMHGGVERSYLVRIPPFPRAGERVPLVVVLHGGGGNALNAESITGFTKLARAEGFIVVYPDGSGRTRLRTWNAGHCCGYAMERNVDDVGFIAALLDRLAERYPIDVDRIYVTGMSNGAMMAHRVGIELSGRVAAIAPVVGAVFGDEALPRRPVSAIMVNGLLDGSVPYAGGSPGGRFPGAWDGTPTRPALEQGSFWATANGCSAASVTRHQGEYVHHVYGCPAGVGVEMYVVEDNGHAWPGGEQGSRRGDAPSSAIDATEVIWRFFAAHPRR